MLMGGHMSRNLIIAAWIAALVGGCVWSKEQAGRRAARRFAEGVAHADHLCVRDIAEQTLCELSGKEQVSDFVAHVQFSAIEEQCECEGDFFFEFSKAGKPLLVVSYHHGTHLRCAECWEDDAYLTEASRDWLVNWFADRGFAWPKQELETERKAAEIGRRAEAELKKVVPPGFAEGMNRAARSARPPRGPDEAMDGFVRSFFRDERECFLTLFRIVGALPMRWDASYWIQFRVRFYLVRVPASELDGAFRLAAASGDPRVRMGAAGVLFSERLWTRHGKTEDQVREWMVLMASTAYSSPFAVNRMMMMEALAKATDKRLVDVLIKAVEDSNQIVRRRAIEALGQYDDERAQTALKEVAEGELLPAATESPEPLDYGGGRGALRPTPYIVLEKYLGSDQEAAKRVLEEIEKRRTGSPATSSEKVKREAWLSDRVEGTSQPV